MISKFENIFFYFLKQKQSSLILLKNCLKNLIEPVKHLKTENCFM